MKKILTIAALATALISAQAYAQAPRYESRSAAAAAQTYNQDASSNFQNQWNDGNW